VPTTNAQIAHDTTSFSNDGVDPFFSTFAAHSLLCFAAEKRFGRDKVLDFGVSSQCRAVMPSDILVNEKGPVRCKPFLAIAAKAAANSDFCYSNQLVLGIYLELDIVDRD
jgi:hypothetical protein